MAPKVKMAYEVDIPYLFLTVKTTGETKSFFAQWLTCTCRSVLGMSTFTSLLWKKYIVGTYGI